MYAAHLCTAYIFYNSTCQIHSRRLKITQIAQKSSPFPSFFCAKLFGIL